jgi:hypothetical protein
MRRFALSLFLIFYTASVVGLSIERTQAWIAEHGRDSKQGQSRQGARIGEWHRRSPRQLAFSKLLEDGSVLASPFVRTSPPHSETTLHHLLFDVVAGQSAQVTSSRAPPTALS